MIYPPGFTYPAEKTRMAEAMATVIAHLVPHRRVVVQAGGCSGLWPLALAARFEQVYTFEPDPTNYHCLTANVASVPNVTAYPYAIGDRPTHIGMTRPKPQPGLWRVEGDGDIPMVRLDDVITAPVDALMLDVEGSEVRALHGARGVIATHRPLLWFEYLHHRPVLDALLTSYGYLSPRRGVGGDYYSLHASRLQ